MAAPKHNLTIDQGSDFVFDLVVSDKGAVKDLTGYGARSHIRSKRTSSTLAASFICQVVSPAVNGVVKMQLPNATSSAMTPGLYFYDLEIFTAGDNLVKRILQGEIILTPEVTR